MDVVIWGVVICWFIGMATGLIAALAYRTEYGGVFLDLTLASIGSLLGFYVTYRVLHIGLFRFSGLALLGSVAGAVIVLIAYQLIARRALATI
ncbi:MAG: hypothetical protein ACYCW6_04915 [Candidatus Xenobia bacterium]